MAAQGSQGVPGVAVGMAGVAALLLYAGFRGVNPLQALREVASGKPKGLAAQTAAHTALYEGIGSAAVAGTGSSGGVAAAAFISGGAHPELARAAQGHAGELYSQTRRWDAGYSDCSSFVGKALKDIGIAPPGASVTGSYLVWSRLTTIDRSAIGAGDLLVSSGHIAIALSNTTAIGQQNSRVNVQTAAISSIMYGQSGWIARRLTGGGTTAVAA